MEDEDEDAEVEGEEEDEEEQVEDEDEDTFGDSVSTCGRTVFVMWDVKFIMFFCMFNCLKLNRNELFGGFHCVQLLMDGIYF